MGKKYVSKVTERALFKMEQVAEHYYLIAARKRANCENLPEWFSKYPVEYYEAAQEATYGAMETLLLESGAYNGFSETYPTNKEYLKSDYAGKCCRSYSFKARS